MNKHKNYLDAVERLLTRVSRKVFEKFRQDYVERDLALVKNQVKFRHDYVERDSAFVRNQVKSITAFNQVQKLQFKKIITRLKARFASL